MKALKEWATVVKALEDGVQTVLLRKGGILETRSGFKVESDRFLLFPTYEHQELERIKPEFHRYVAEVGSMLKDRHSITSYAEIVDQKDIVLKEQVKELTGYHIWSDQYIQSRIDWMPDRPLKAVFLRVYRIPEIKIETRREYRGCKSWLEINADIDSGKPVLDDNEIGTKLSKFAEIVN